MSFKKGKIKNKIKNESISILNPFKSVIDLCFAFERV